MKENDYRLGFSSSNQKISMTDRFNIASNSTLRPQLPSHHDKFEITWFLDGDIMFAFEGELIDLSPGDMVFLPPRSIHRTIMKSVCRYHRKHIKFTEDIFVMLEPNGLILRNLLTKHKIIKFNRHTVEELQLDKLFLEIENCLKKNTPYDDFRAAISLLYLMTKAETSFSLSDCTKSGVSTTNSQKAHEIIQYIDRNISSELNYQTIAQQFFMSEKNLYRFFKKETGFTLAKYIKERRIVRAKSILLEGGSASDAAIASGFQDYSVFYRTFLRETGVTPSNFKNRESTEIF